MQIRHSTLLRTPHNIRGKTSPIGGVSNPPQVPVQGKPTVPGATDIPPEILAAIGATKREPT